MMNKEQIKVFSRGTSCTNSFLYLFHLFQRSFPCPRSFERIPAMCIVLRNYVETTYVIDREESKRFSRNVSTYYSMHFSFAVNVFICNTQENYSLFPFWRIVIKKKFRTKLWNKISFYGINNFWNLFALSQRINKHFNF